MEKLVPLFVLKQCCRPPRHCLSTNSGTRRENNLRKPMADDKSEKLEKKSYKDTLNLPQTAFPMEAKLVQNEPARLKKWQEAKLYDQVLAARANAPRWVLHDGPPFANGDIHIGHVINKTLKDVIVKFRTMQGH